MPKIKIILGDILKDRDMTQTELVKLTGIRSETISNLTRGKVERITIEHLCKIMTALEITNVNETLKYRSEPVIETVIEPIVGDEQIEMLNLSNSIFQN